MTRRSRPIAVMRRSPIIERDANPMIKSIVGDLRCIAERCSKSARDCKMYELARALDELGIDLMTKASELEKKFDV